MAEELIEHLRGLVTPLFRPEALVKLVATPDGGWSITASWRLGTHRMDNWSKEIDLRLPPAVAERYGKLNDKGRSKADLNLVSFIKRKLVDFNPEHDRPRFLLPPVEVWEVGYDELFSKSAG
jgi:hypothetical protein